jgi:hypothetical protein
VQVFRSTPALAGEGGTRLRRSEAAKFLAAACHRSMTDRQQFYDGAIV